MCLEKLFWNAAVLEIICAVMFSDFAQDAAGVADGDDPARQIMRDDAARSDHRIVAYGNAGNDDRARPYPAIFADMHWEIILIHMAPKLRIYWVSRRRDGHVRSEHGIVAHIYVRVVHKRQIEIRINVFAEMHMAPAEIRSQRRLYIAVFADLGKHLQEKLSAALNL